MRKFQVNGNAGLIADVLGAYGYYDQQRLAKHIALMNQYMEEKNIARHYPGVHWQALQMDLADDFKKALLIKAEIFVKKKTSDLTWELAKICAANPEQINQNAIPSVIKDLIAHAKPFANLPSFLELSPSSAPAPSSEVKEHKEEHEVVEETTATNGGDMLAFSFSGSSPSVSSSSTLDSLNATHQEVIRPLSLNF